MFVSNGMKNARFLLPTKRNESLLYFSAAARGQRVFQRRDDRCAPIESAEIPRRSNNGANCFGVEPCLPDRVCRAVQSSRVRYSAVEIGKKPLLLHRAPCLFRHGPIVLAPPRNSTGAR